MRISLGSGQACLPVVWEAYERVKANKGAAGVDDQSIAEFDRDW